MAKRFVKILLPTDSPIILVFVTKGRCLTLMASPVTEAPNTGGVRKLGDFWPKSWCVSETVRDTALVATEVE